MSMLGAELGELHTLAAQLNTTAGDILTANGEAGRGFNTAVADLEAAVTAAAGAVQAAMDQLIGTVDTARAQLDGTTWTGNNRATFDGAYGDFQAAMTAARGTTDQTVADLGTAITGINEQLSAYVAELNTALANASEASTSMSTAVTSQADNLDQVMNTGMG